MTVAAAAVVVAVVAVAVDATLAAAVVVAAGALQFCPVACYPLQLFRKAQTNEQPFCPCQPCTAPRHRQPCPAFSSLELKTKFCKTVFPRYRW